ncbi:hypothetical protein DOTSEDRAFT_72759 [Dothistroma septosporum NZE10]|uniref:AMP-dependent synthetase/ligase domain-containing protein n=1 Tax=Dothistroma septosporum (strain NZE10 / CBS 128990) TaxID=675120 RepID=M2XM16_DOTSN|nr:hypothetical protein DOTSEDRAFT_72759 [Dothistroma septosporum NZE10]
MSSSLQSLDAQIAKVLSEWSLVTTVLAVILIGFLIHPLIYADEPDTHPLLLARQATASPVRNKGESAVYRSPEVPHGYSLRTGLNVKDHGAPRWASGKDGDVRDIWREVRRGGKQGADGKDIPKGLIMTVLGKEDLVEHDIDELSQEIGIIGQHLKKNGANKVAVYLPNSIEYLQMIFATAFYGLTPILLPYNVPHAKLYKLLADTGADSLVCSAGDVPQEDLAKQAKNIKLLTLVVERTSRHMDWDGAPEGGLSVGVWHNIVEDNKSSATIELPDNDGDKPGAIVTVWQPTDLAKEPEIVSFTQENIVSAVAAQISAIPLRQRLTSADLVLPADTFTHNYVLTNTFATLFTHSSLAINSVAVPGADLSLARRGIAPTVIIASAETLAKLHQQETAGIRSGLQRFGKYTQDQTISAGRMPTDGLLFKLLAPSSTSNEPGKLRLILTSERIGAGSPALTSTQLSDLRIFTRSRIIYALTAARVAGAVAQTNVFDYRRDDGPGHSHFGVPLSSVEVKLVGGEEAVGAESPRGQLTASGPAVAGGEVKLSAQGRVRQDSTIAYA